MTGCCSQRELTLAGADAALRLRTFEDAVAIRAELQPGRHVVIIGAGFIGLEVAASASVRGCRVTVLETAPRVLGRAVPPELAAEILRRHIAAGVDVRCGVMVQAIESVGTRSRVVIDDTTAGIEADVVVAGVGSVPNIELAAAAGLAIDNGIATDGFLRTSDPDIFAAGDCCAPEHVLFDQRRIRLESWRAALDQARVAAAGLLGSPREYTAVPWFWSDHYELSVQVAGLPNLAATEVVRARPDGSSLRFGLAADGRLLSAAGVAVGNALSRDIRVAEKLIASHAHPDLAVLVDPSTPLKSLLQTSIGKQLDL
jgi:3-phenylpropionate/trans-cinnamate dioxygenase ferredoxin reductase component